MGRTLFVVFVALDLAALGLAFVLGLAAAKPAHASAAAVVAFFAVPAMLLAGLVWLHLRGPWRGSRTVATVLAGLPVAAVAAGSIVSAIAAWRHGAAGDGWARPHPPAQHRLEQAIAAGDAAAVARIAREAGSAVNHGAALLAAVQRMEPPAADAGPLRALLQAGVRPDAGGADVSPLVAAIRISRSAGAGPARLLLDAGADPNARRGMQPAWFEALAPRTDAAVLPALLAHGANLQMVDAAGNGPLHWAVHHRHWATAALLLEHGAPWRGVRLPGGPEALDRRVADELRRHPGDPVLARLDRLLKDRP